MLSIPWLAGRSPTHKYRFDIPGVSYGLFVGKDAQLVSGKGCAARFGVISITPAAERECLKSAAFVRKNATIKRKLREPAMKD